MFGAGRRGVDGPGGRRRGDSLDKGDVYRERSPLDDRGRDRGDRYKYSLMQCCVPLCDWNRLTVVQLPVACPKLNCSVGSQVLAFRKMRPILTTSV